MTHLQQLKDLDDLCDKYIYANRFGEVTEKKFGQITWLMEDGGKYTLNFKGELIENDVRLFDED